MFTTYKPFFLAEGEGLLTKVCLENSAPMRDFRAFGDYSVCKEIKGERLGRGSVEGHSGQI